MGPPVTPCHRRNPIGWSFQLSIAHDNWYKMYLNRNRGCFKSVAFMERKADLIVFSTTHATYVALKWPRPHFEAGAWICSCVVLCTGFSWSTPLCQRFFRIQPASHGAFFLHSLWFYRNKEHRSSSLLLILPIVTPYHGSIQDAPHVWGHEQQHRKCNNASATTLV